MMMQKTTSTKKRVIIFSIIAIVLVGGLIAGGYYLYAERNKKVGSYDECVALGNPVMESHPARCSTPDGKQFIDPHATVTVEGTAVCLPHKKSGEMHTMECAIGVKDAEGKYYGVSGDKENKLAGITGSDQKVRVTGTIETTENSMYDITELIAIKTIELE